MISGSSFEEIATSVCSLSKPEIKSRLKNFKGNLKLDFTEPYLDSLSLDKLRHILASALVTVARKRT